MKEIAKNFIQANSPDGGFLQSEEWRKFQESYGRKTFHIEGEKFWANIIEHKLKLVGSYFYVPRGPLGNGRIDEIIKLAKDNKSGWIRIEPVNNSLDSLGGETSKLGKALKKAPHDMQPKEIFEIDITKSEEELLKEMKAKTRYNVKLAEKKGVKIVVVDNNSDNKKYFAEFLRLVRITAKRNEISAHPENYYRKMWEVLPTGMLKLYVAEYEDKVIAANLVLFYGQFATYLHGASDNQFRDVMAPYLLQWQAIKDAKNLGCEKYDFGGISTNYELNTNIRITNKFSGITKFKIGFSPNILPINFPGSYDIILNSKKYYIYRILQFLKNIF
jgi:lipid II:glycine glycyltransferase (peptidoglycan interpeptide bridge formation enzyme)